jgi:GTP1/Obg family GTP-binding protein
MQGDIKQDQKELFKKIKAALKSGFIVAFNKVDARDPGSYIRGCAIEEYFKQQRSKTAKELACHKDAIHCVCLQPDLDRVSRFKMLEKSGIFYSEKLYDKVLTDVKNWGHQSL